MNRTARVVQNVIVSAGMLIALAGSALATDLTGVWASGREACDKIFIVKGGRTSFQRNADVHGSGFIIEGGRIRGRVATCKVIRTKVDQAIVHMIASCATDVMLSNVQLVVRVVNADEIWRVFPGMEDMEIPYYRCPSPKGKR